MRQHPRYRPRHPLGIRWRRGADGHHRVDRVHEVRFGRFNDAVLRSHPLWGRGLRGNFSPWSRSHSHTPRTDPHTANRSKIAAMTPVTASSGCQRISRSASPRPARPADHGATRPGRPCCGSRHPAARGRARTCGAHTPRRCSVAARSSWGTMSLSSSGCLPLGGRTDRGTVAAGDQRGAGTSGHTFEGVIAKAQDVVLQRMCSCSAIQVELPTTCSACMRCCYRTAWAPPSLVPAPPAHGAVRRRLAGSRLRRRTPLAGRDAQRRPRASLCRVRGGPGGPGCWPTPVGQPAPPGHAFGCHRSSGWSYTEPDSAPSPPVVRARP